jgi:hypothetical protein
MQMSRELNKAQANHQLAQIALNRLLEAKGELHELLVDYHCRSQRPTEAKPPNRNSSASFTCTPTERNADSMQLSDVSHCVSRPSLGSRPNSLLPGYGEAIGPHESLGLVLRISEDGERGQ